MTPSFPEAAVAVAESAPKQNLRRRPEKASRERPRESPREAASRLYYYWLRKPCRIDELVERAVKVEAWERRDRGLFFELLYGVVRWHGLLIHLLQRASERRKLPPEPVVAAAAVGLYQILHLDRVPVYAAVDAAVRIARRRGGSAAAGWVNAVLRSAARDPVKFRDIATRTSSLATRLALTYSHPEWMVVRWMKWMPENALRIFLEWNNRRPGLSLRAPSPEVVPVWEKELAHSGLKVTIHNLDPCFIMVEGAGHPSELRAVAEGWASVQDVSQGLVARLAAPQDGELVLDLCAAPGGKTGHLAELCPGCRITATDKSAERLQVLAEAVNRRGWRNVRVVSYDEVLGGDQRFDVVMVDAPCSGTGVLARRPDLRWRRLPGDIPRFAAVQLQLLSYAANRLNPNGRIIYSTCSVEPEENTGVVAEFLRERPGFTVENARDFVPPAVVDPSGAVSVLGPEVVADGVFAVRLKRRELFMTAAEPSRRGKGGA